MRIAIISPGFPSDEAESTCLPFVQSFVLELQRRGHELVVLNAAYPAKENYSWNSIPVLPLQRKASIFQKIAARFRLSKLLDEIHKTDPLGLVCSFWYNWASVQADRFAYKNRLQHVMFWSGTEHLKLTKPIRFNGLQLCLSSFHQMSLEQHGQQAITVNAGIPNFVSRTAEKKIDLLWCGWLNQNKNLDLFLDIVSELKNEIHSAVVCGGGDVASWKEKLKRQRLEKTTRMTGLMDHEKVMSLMSETKVLVHTSAFESFGLVIAEAIANGCHIVSTPVGIASSDPSVNKCTTVAEFVSAIRSCLAAPAPASSQRYPISNTVDKLQSMLPQLFHSHAER